MVLGNPFDECADVADRILAFETIVAREKRLAVAAGAANVGIDDRDAELIEIVVVARLEAGTRLAFRAAVDADDHGTFSRELASVGTIDKRGDWRAIETVDL